MPRWPAAPVELLFNAVLAMTILLLRWRGSFPGQHFHIYLIAYGLFRFGHEFLRDTPRIVGPLSGYQIAASGIAILGCAGFILRRRRLADDNFLVEDRPSSLASPVEARPTN